MHRPRRSFAARRSWPERASHRLRDAYQELTHWGVAEALRAAGMRAPSWSTPHWISNRKPSGPVQRSGQRCSLARARFPDRADAMGGHPSVAFRYRASRVAGTSGSDPNRGASGGRTRRIQGPLRRGNAMCAGHSRSQPPQPLTLVGLSEVSTGLVVPGRAAAQRPTGIPSSDSESRWP